MTLNEEVCIANAIESVINLSNDIVVLDSYSSDKTKEVVQSYPTVRFIQNPFVDFSSQRNFGLHSIDYTNEWVFMLDADEECTEKLFREMLEKSSEDKSKTSFLVQRKDFYNHKWIKVHANVWFERLLKCKAVSFSGTVHEKLATSKRQGKLNERFNHYPFVKGIPNWMHRHAQYAEEMANIALSQRIPFYPLDLFSTNNAKNENARKALFQRLPFKFIFYFLYKFFLQKGFMGGVDGLHFVTMETFYQYLVTINIRKIKKGGNQSC